MPKVKQNGVEFGRGAGYDQDGLEWTHGRVSQCYNYLYFVC